MSGSSLPRDELYDSRMIRAILNNDITEATNLVAIGIDLDYRIHESTYLHKCFYNNRFMMAEFLIDNGADVNARDPDGYMPLHLAVKKNRAELVVKLLTKGADRFAEDHRHRKPCDLPGPKLVIDWGYLSSNALLALNVNRAEELVTLLISDGKPTDTLLELQGADLIDQIIGRSRWSRDDLPIAFGIMKALKQSWKNHFYEKYNKKLNFLEAWLMRTAVTTEVDTALARYIRGDN